MKKLLIVTQKVNINDPILGFFHRWIIEFAKHWQTVTIICLEKGEYKLPENVKVLSLGKEKSGSKIGYFLNFYKYLWGERKNYDAVFVHMNPVYVVLGGIFWRLFGKQIALWYTHKSVDLKLRIAEKLVHKIFTASKESFRLKTKKVEIMGHGIDTDYFKCDSLRNFNRPLKILHVGRITKIKNCDTIIKAVDLLKNKNIDSVLTFVGGPVTDDDKKYFEGIKNLIGDLKLQKNIIFAGNVTNEKVKDFYCKTDICINASPTGGMDKAVLEAISCGRLVFLANKTFENILGGYSKDFIFQDFSGVELSKKIEKLLLDEDVLSKAVILRGKVVLLASVGDLINKIFSKLK